MSRPWVCKLFQSNFNLPLLNRMTVQFNQNAATLFIRFVLLFLVEIASVASPLKLKLSKHISKVEKLCSATTDVQNPYHVRTGRKNCIFNFLFAIHLACFVALSELLFLLRYANDAGLFRKLPSSYFSFISFQCFHFLSHIKNNRTFNDDYEFL